MLFYSFCIFHLIFLKCLIFQGGNCPLAPLRTPMSVHSCRSMQVSPCQTDFFQCCERSLLFCAEDKWHVFLCQSLQWFRQCDKLCNESAAVIANPRKLRTSARFSSSLAWASAFTLSLSLFCRANSLIRQKDPHEHQLIHFGLAFLGVRCQVTFFQPLQDLV